MNHYQITLKNASITYDCLADQSLLNGMEQLGIKGIPVGCRNGGCGVCKVHILEGAYKTKKMSRAHISETEQDDGVVLACRCNPVSNLILEVIGEMKDAIYKK